MYDQDEQIARYQESTKHLVRQLKHLAFCFDTFLIALEMAKEYQQTADKLSAMAKSAFTKAILVDYANPFMENEFEDGRKETVSTRYLLKNPHFDREMHESLLELRHNLIAHAHFESPGIAVTLAEFINNRREENTHAVVYVPGQYFLQNSSLLFVDAPDLLARLVHHIAVCGDLTVQKAHELFTMLGETMLAYAPVANSADCTTILSKASDSEYESKTETDPLGIRARVLELKIGKVGPLFTVTRLRHDDPFIGEYRGNGYVIRSKRIDDDPSKISITVSFPYIQDENL